MFGHKFYHQAIRKYIILFGTIFNDIHIERRNSNNNVIQTIKCPLTYAPREKVTARLEQNPAITEQQSVLLPRLSFEWTNMMYDPSRKLNTMNKWRKDPGDAATGGKMKYQFQPVPYDLMFDFNIYTRYAEDATQILEQISPSYTSCEDIDSNIIGISTLVPISGIKLIEAVNSGVKKGDICSNICVASSAYLV